MKDVCFGLNSIPEEKVTEFKKIIEEEGICEAYWECIGRGLHYTLARKLERMLPEYEFDIDYDHYKCVAHKR